MARALWTIFQLAEKWVIPLCFDMVDDIILQRRQVCVLLVICDSASQNACGSTHLRFDH